MSSRDCGREDELLAALGRGFVARELEDHAAVCPTCRELRLVAGALLDDRTEAIAEAAVPSAGTMWWRLRVRQRHEAVARARRSLLVGQAVTLVVAIGLAVLLFGADVAAGLRELTASLRLGTPALVALGISALLAPLAGWIALRQE